MATAATVVSFILFCLSYHILNHIKMDVVSLFFLFVAEASVVENVAY